MIETGSVSFFGGVRQLLPYHLMTMPIHYRHHPYPCPVNHPGNQSTWFLALRPSKGHRNDQRQQP